MAANLPGSQPRPHMRRILPAPALTKRPTSPPPQQPPPKARAPKVVAACAECRKHKCRCSGERPTCRRCLTQNIHCRYRDVVTPEALQQTNKALRDRVNASEEILRLLKNLPDQEAHDVLARLRSGASVSAIVNQVKAGDLLLQLAVAPETRFRYEFPYRSEMPAEFVVDNPYLNSTLYRAASLYGHTSPLTRPNAAPTDQGTADLQSLYLKPFHAAHMVDPRLSDARPSRWTAVCDDDVLMRDLLAVWFRCEYQFTSACQKDYFLEDMVAKRQDFCSSLLVNIVLAYACVCYPRFSNRAEYWNPHTLLYRFLAEAKRLWELEAAAPRLTTIQAGLFFNVFHNLCGLDEIGQAYRIHAIALAHELRFYDGPITAPSEKMRQAKIYTAWALYSWESLVGFSFMIPPLLEQPPHDPLPDPAKDAQWYGEIWLKYPSSQVLTPACFGYGFKAKCDFRLLMNEFCHAAYSTGSGGSVSLDEANQLRKRLVAWYDGLPRPLLPENIVFPSQLQLHMYYHSLLLSIYEPLLEAPATRSPSPQAVVAEATRYLQTLVRLYYLRHGFESMDLFIVVPLVHAGFRCLDDIRAHGDRLAPARLEVLRATLLLVAKGLHSQRAHHYLAEALFRVVRGRMRPQEASLLQTTLPFDEGEAERRSAMAQAVRSHWPVAVVKKKEDLDEHVLGRLVENYAHLNVASGTEGGDLQREASGSVPSAGQTEKS